MRGSLSGRMLQHPGSACLCFFCLVHASATLVLFFYYAAFTGDPDVHIPMDVRLNPELTPST